MNARRVSRIRRSYDLSQAELANLLHVTRRTIVRWENDEGQKPTGLQLLVLEALERTAKKINRLTGFKRDSARAVLQAAWERETPGGFLRELFSTAYPWPDLPRGRRSRR